MLEPPNRGWGFNPPPLPLPPYWFQQMAEPERERESFSLFFFPLLFRWLHAQANSSGELATASLNIHSRGRHARHRAHAGDRRGTAVKGKKKYRPCAHTVQKSSDRTSSQCGLNYWTVSTNGFHSSRRLIIRVRVLLIIHSQLIAFFFNPLSLSLSLSTSQYIYFFIFFSTLPIVRLPPNLWQ